MGNIPDSPVPATEARRLQAVRACGLLDTAPEERFDELVQLAALICEAPVSLITLLDEERNWFKARYGVAATESPRGISFCTHAIEQEELYVIPDTLDDPLFAQNPLVCGVPHVRFYAGYPLSAEGGEKLGTLCVIDTVPRELSLVQRTALEVLARQVATQMRLNSQMAALDATAAEKEQLTRRLADSDACFRGFMDASPAAAFIKDEAGRMTYCNQALTGRYGATPEDWLGKDDGEIWPPDAAEKYRAADARVLQGQGTVHYDDDTVTPDGQAVSWSVYKFPFANAEGARFLAGVAINVTKERKAERELRRYQQELRELNLKLHKLSLTDGLTRIKNRRGLEDCLEREFQRARRSDAPLSMLMLDVDHFKQFNDTFGHVAGDQVLQRIAVLMKEYTRQTDIVARYGGEEFITLMPDTEESEALLVANRLCQFIANDHWPHRAITVSVGVGVLPPHITEPSAFVHGVDEALYAAKHGGRNQVCLAAKHRLEETIRLLAPEPAYILDAASQR